MNRAGCEHNLRQAREHRDMAGRERQLAEAARAAGALDQEQRHLIDASLHEKRAEAYEAAAGPHGPVPGGAR